jgi:hypothetical protein
VLYLRFFDQSSLSQTRTSRKRKTVDRLNPHKVASEAASFVKIPSWQQQWKKRDTTATPAIHRQVQIFNSAERVDFELCNKEVDTAEEEEQEGDDGNISKLQRR